MFSKIKIVTETYDLGKFAELSIFYGSVDFPFSESFFNSLSKRTDSRKFIKFIIENDNLRPFYNKTSVITSSGANPSINIRIGGYEDVGDKDFIEYCSDHRIFGDDTLPFINKLNFSNYDDAFLELIYQEMESDQFLNFLSEVIKCDLNELKKEIAIERNSYSITLNLKNNFSRQTIYDALRIYLNAKSYEYECAQANSDLILANEKFVLSDTTQALLIENEIIKFHDLALDDIPSISETINSGQKNFSEFIELYEKSKKFKEWLMHCPENQSLVKEYFQSVMKENWSDRLPNKTVRWSLFTGLGLGLDIIGLGGIGTAAGVVISAMDSFFLDRMVNGWKPNKFITDVKKFSQ